MRAVTMALMRCEVVSPKTLMQCRGRSAGVMMPARNASSMSWLMYATLSQIRTICPFQSLGHSRPRMVENPVPHFPGQVELFQVVHHPQALLVVTKAAGMNPVQFVFSGMAKRSMSQVMAQGNGLGKGLR